LILKGNDFGNPRSNQNNSEFIISLNGLVSCFHLLKELNISDCQLYFYKDENFDDNLWKRFFITIKSKFNY
jgi:hypothetical protein